ncbi:MAG: AAA family ATPase [Planctomycetes bacterium]|nr:AAA family ATPase [Planctomycetota bacterium]
MLRLSSLRASNLKCLGEVHMDLDPRWNVILGDNASGKSTLLKAMAVASLGRFPTQVEEAEWLRQGTKSLALEIELAGERREAPGLMESDPNKSTPESPAGSSASDSVCFKCLESLDPGVEDPAQNRRWEVRKSGARIYETAGSIALGEKTPVVFIPALRPTGTGSDSIRASLEPAPSPSAIRAEMINRAIQGVDPIGSIFTRLGQAYLRASIDQLQKVPTHQLEYATYQEAVRKFMPSYELLPYSISQGRVDITNDRCQVPFGRLSDGEKSSLGIVLRVVEGILYSRAVLDPVQLDQPAIIIIDELDAHLHPAWQRTIIRRLNMLCPAAQFIVATHSPLVLTGLVGLKTSFALHRLIPSKEGVQSESVTSQDGALLGDSLLGLLGKLFGTTDLPERVQELQDQIALLLQKADEPGLKPDEEARLDELQSELDCLSGLRSEPGHVGGRGTPTPSPA